MITGNKFEHHCGGNLAHSLQVCFNSNSLNSFPLCHNILIGFQSRLLTRPLLVFHLAFFCPFGVPWLIVLLHSHFSWAWGHKLLLYQYFQTMMQGSISNGKLWRVRACGGCFLKFNHLASSLEWVKFQVFLICGPAHPPPSVWLWMFDSRHTPSKKVLFFKINNQNDYSANFRMFLEHYIRIVSSYRKLTEFKEFFFSFLCVHLHIFCDTLPKTPVTWIAV